MTDDLVTAVSSLSHDGEFNSLGRRTKEPPDLQTTLSRASQRNKSMRSRETRDMSEELNSRAQSERQGIVHESDMGVFSIMTPNIHSISRNKNKFLRTKECLYML